LLIGGGVLTVAVIAVVVLILVTTNTDAAPEQPLAFSHQVHASNGISCQYCHAGVNKSPVAGIPSVEKCMGCHTYIATDRDEIQKLTTYWEDGEPIPWQRVHQQPSYVFFTHAAHIAAEVSCGSCHGDVASMTVAKEVVNMNMGFCLDCHAEQEGKKDALYDCAVCHR